jgi:hypothetical protein
LRQLDYAKGVGQDFEYAVGSADEILLEKIMSIRSVEKSIAIKQTDISVGAKSERRTHVRARVS